MRPNAANHVPLSPLSFLPRAAAVFPEAPAVVHGALRLDWQSFEARCRRLGSALARRGIGPGDTVAIVAPNTPAMLEAHHGVPGIGAVLNPINTRLDAAAIAFILRHGEARALLVDREFGGLARAAIALLEAPPPLVVDIADAELHSAHPAAFALDYEALLAEGDPEASLGLPSDEWDPLILSYTSGTTGDPKGVVYHHRGAYLNAMANVAAWAMPKRPVMLWTLPIFHSLGWCFPWTIGLMGGTHVCLRKVEARAIFRLIAEEGVTHLCGAPVVLNTLINAAAEERVDLPQRVQVMTAASPPPPAVIERIERMGFDVLHVYGLTEVFGPSAICEWQPGWAALDAEGRAAMKARQGVAYPSVEGLRVVETRSMQDVPADGTTLGEVLKRSNTVMRGYLKNPRATEEAFAGGWFHTGDLGVMHPDGYIELKDRSKDIIISGGENVSTIEVEAVLYEHPAVLEAAVVARPDAHWGETPCAFVELRPGAAAAEEDIIAFCRSRLARFKAPRSVVFGPLPKTSTGKVQKFVLRERARELDEQGRTP
jgi:fatty-acyl-CoA synthase